MRRTGIILALFFGAAALLSVGFFVSSFLTPAGGAENDRGVLANLISRALSSPGMRVSIGAVDGALSSDATIRNVVIADAQGPWLKVDHIRLSWTRAALLLRRLEVDRLDIGKIEFLRMPLPSPTAKKEARFLPELPVKIIVRHFALADLVLGKFVLGVAAQLSAKGHASLGDPSEGLDVAFDAERIDAPGSFRASLSFAPKTQDLKINLTAQEPHGGLATRVLSLPGAPPMNLSIVGAGTLDAFSANLAFAAGPDAQAAGTLRLARSGLQRRLDLNLRARLAGLLPMEVRTFAQGRSRLDVTLGIGDDRSVAIDKASLVTSAARLDVSGGVDSTGLIDVSAKLRPVDSNAAMTFRAKHFNLDAKLTGTLKEPQFAASVDLAKVRVPAGGVESLKGTVSARANGPLGVRGSQISFAARGGATGLNFTDARLASAIGGTLALDLRGDLATDGTANFSRAKLTADHATLIFVGVAGLRAVKGRLRARVDDLAAFRGFLGRRLSGSLRAAVDLTGSPRDKSLAGAVAIEWDRPKTGVPSIDGLLGAKATIKGAVAEAGPTGVSFSNLRLASDGVSARVNGRATAKAADVEATVLIPDLRLADPRLTGGASAKAKWTGSFAEPRVAIHIALSEATALGRPIASMSLDLSGEDVAGAISAKADVSGMIAAKAAHGSLALARLPDGAWRLSPFQIAVGTNAISGDLTLSSQRLASGALRVRASDLDDFSPLLLQKMSGRLDADVVLDGAGGRQNARIDAKAVGLRTPVFAAKRIAAALTVSGATSRAVLDGGVTIDRAVVAGQAFSSLRLHAKGANESSALSVVLQAHGWSLRSAGTLVANRAPELDLTSLELLARGHRIGLATPAKLTIGRGGVRTDRLALIVDSGRLTLSGRAGATLDFMVLAQSFPLEVAGLVAPRLGLSGIVNGQAHIAGTPHALNGTWRFAVTRLSSASSRRAGLPLVKASASGDFEHDGARFSALVVAGAGSSIRLSGYVPFVDSGLDLSAKGFIDAALAQDVLPDGERLTGKLALDLRATGALKAPRFAGAAFMTGGSFADATSGARLVHLQARLGVKGERLEISSLLAETPGGGSFSASGNIELLPRTGFPAYLRIKARRARLFANDLGTATANIALSVTGPLARRPKLAGQIAILAMELAIPERLPHALEPLPNLRILNPTPAAAARLTLAAKQKAIALRRLPFYADIDLQVSAENQIFVRGRGLNAEFGGHLILNGSLRQPIARGAFNLIDGSLDFLTKKLDLTTGRLSFVGGFIPNLNIAGQTTSGGITAQVSVVGPANKPQFTFSSTPALPQDEILSRILFAKPSAGLSPIQALQLADLATQLAGHGDGSGFFEKIRRSLGVDSFDVGTDAAGNAQVGASRYINNHMTLGLKTGAKPQDSAVSLGVDLTNRLRAQGSVGADGSSAVGLGMEWNY